MGRMRTINDLININPCLDCEGRHKACHDHCKPYKEWKKEYEDFKKKEKVAKGSEYFQKFRGQDYKHKFPDK